MIALAALLVVLAPAALIQTTPAAQDALPIRIAIHARAIQPGELLLARLTVPDEATGVSVLAFGRTFPAYFAEAGVWEALVAVDLEQTPGPYTVTAEAHVGDAVLTGQRQLEVQPKLFRTRTLRVAPEFVEPPPKQARRIADEAAFLAMVYASSAPARYWEMPFTRPVQEPANSAFGSRSVFNGQPRAPHSGTDFASPAGTPVKAPTGGQVVAARDLFFTGNTVIIDHGLGVMSVLAHLSRLDVEEGEMVSAGDVVGLVGATGRVTGPHLHWTLRVSNARVDPVSALVINK